MGKKQKIGLSRDQKQEEDPQPSGNPAPEPRHHTLSLAVPGSCLESAPSLEYATYVAGQIARIAVAYHVDEVVVYDDVPGTGKDKGTVSSGTTFLGT
jgi:hypothetical protein